MERKVPTQDSLNIVAPIATVPGMGIFILMTLRYT